MRRRGEDPAAERAPPRLGGRRRAAGRRAFLQAREVDRSDTAAARPQPVRGPGPAAGRRAGWRRRWRRGAARPPAWPRPGGRARVASEREPSRRTPSTAATRGGVAPPPVEGGLPVRDQPQGERAGLGRHRRDGDGEGGEARANMRHGGEGDEARRHGEEGRDGEAVQCPQVDQGALAPQDRPGVAARSDRAGKATRGIGQPPPPRRGRSGRPTARPSHREPAGRGRGGGVGRPASPEDDEGAPDGSAAGRGPATSPRCDDPRQKDLGRRR